MKCDVWRQNSCSNVELLFYL